MFRDETFSGAELLAGAVLWLLGLSFSVWLGGPWLVALWIYLTASVMTMATLAVLDTFREKETKLHVLAIAGAIWPAAIGGLGLSIAAAVWRGISDNAREQLRKETDPHD